MSYVSHEQHLKIVMNLLLADSHAIQAEAFHLFKIFVVNPHKPLRIQQILVKNKEGGAGSFVKVAMHPSS
eukprot:Skav217381  [mRNA]  locus=scaffold4362:12860:13450:- [translate_table: standard]